jgi:hypothetical protein
MCRDSIYIISKDNGNNTSEDIETRKIIIFDAEIESEESTASGPRPAGVRDALRRFKVKTSEVTVDQLKKNINDFLTNVEDILEDTKLSGNYGVDSVEVNAEISANGQVGFMGTGIGLAGKTGIKFVLKRSARTGNEM